MDCSWKRLGHFCGVVSVLVGCQGGAMREARGKKQEFVETWLDGQCAFIRANNSGRLLDADTALIPNVVTKPSVGDGTQKWCFTFQGTQDGTHYFTVQYETFGGRFLDTNLVNNAILRPDENNSSQEWLVGDADLGEGGAGYEANTRLRQRSTNRYLDEYTHPLIQQATVSTQPWQGDGTQEWDLAD